MQVPVCGHHHNIPRGQQVLLHAAGHLWRRAGDAGECRQPCFFGQRCLHIALRLAAEACVPEQEEAQAEEAQACWLGACGPASTGRAACTWSSALWCSGLNA